MIILYKIPIKENYGSYIKIWARAQFQPVIFDSFARFCLLLEFFYMIFSHDLFGDGAVLHASAFTWSFCIQPFIWSNPHADYDALRANLCIFSRPARSWLSICANFAIRFHLRSNPTKKWKIQITPFPLLIRNYKAKPSASPSLGWR